jgi:hypothetical protein
MKLEEEKKLVGEKLKLTVRWWINWNPDRNRNLWPEIWEKMNQNQIALYIVNLWSLLDVDDKWDYEHTDLLLVHTTPPEICWKALVKTLT